MLKHLIEKLFRFSFFEEAIHALNSITQLTAVSKQIFSFFMWQCVDDPSIDMNRKNRNKSTNNLFELKIYFIFIRMQILQMWILMRVNKVNCMNSIFH